MVPELSQFVTQYGASGIDLPNNDTRIAFKCHMCIGNCGNMYFMTVRNNDYVVSKIRGVAAEKRLSQQSMADLLNVSRMSMSRRMTSKTPFTPEELVTLADAMGVPVSTFFGESASERIVERVA